MLSDHDLYLIDISGSLDCMTRRDGKDFYNGIRIDTFKSIDEIDRIISGGVPLDEKMIYGAILFGNIDVVQRLVWGMGGKLPPFLMECSVFLWGCCDIEILKFLASLGCHHESEVFFCTILYNGDLDAMKWSKSIGNYDWQFEDDPTWERVVSSQYWEYGTENAIKIFEWMKSEGCEMCTCGDYDWGKSHYTYVKGEWVYDSKKYSEHDFSGQELSHGLAMKEWLASQVCSKHGK